MSRRSSSVEWTPRSTGASIALAGDASRPGDALALRGRAAVALARLAYRLFLDRFAGERWQRLVRPRGTLQWPLWASTSTKNPALPDTLYVDSLIGPDTVNTLPEATIAAFEDHGASPGP